MELGIAFGIFLKCLGMLTELGRRQHFVQESEMDLGRSDQNPLYNRNLRINYQKLWEIINCK